MINPKSDKKLEVMRHSASHLMAAAILELFPKTKFGIGPTVENGFYYDIDINEPITPDILKKIEKKTKHLAKQNLKFSKKEISLADATKLFKKLKQPYKLELLKDLKKIGTTKIKDKNKGKNQKKNKTIQRVKIYQVGEFIDLCRGPHVKSTKELGAFKLNKIAGAYWRGDEKNKMLQRIYGTAFANQKDLDDYLTRLKEAEKRDHRKLGQKLDYFSFSDQVGVGLPLWHPKGARLIQIIKDFLVKEHYKNDYEWVLTPHIGKLDLWKTSGHWNFYRENLYSPIDIDHQKYLIKPMNCPFHIKIYQNQIKSWRDLPIRWAEFGTVYRYERSGVLHGLTRVRGFTQDDAHTFCLPEQLDTEIEKTVKFGIEMLKTFGFKNYDIYLSTRPDKYVGTPKIWNKATKALEKALKKSKLKYQVDKGEGTFYGPKIDIKIKDSLGRAWQCTTVQVDFNLPERFDISYIDKKGKKQQPIMIHRALLGSLERFVGVLLEHYAGALPMWLSPIQVVIIPINSNNKYNKFSQKLIQELKEKEIRVKIDNSNETISYRVRKAEKQKIPYILVVGDKEINGKMLNIRMRGGKIEKMSRKKLIEKILEEIAKKK